MSMALTESSSESSFLPKKHPGSLPDPKRIVRVHSLQERKPYLYIKSKKYLETKSKSQNIDAKKGSCYLTQYEREQLERAESKKKFLHGDFKRHSGLASAIPLRKEGAVRASGAYLPPIRPHHKDNNRPLYGAWHPTPSGAKSSAFLDAEL